MRLLSLMRYRVAAILVLAGLLITAVAVPIAVRAAHAGGGALPPTMTTGTHAAPPTKTMGTKATPPKKAPSVQHAPKTTSKADPKKADPKATKKPCRVDFDHLSK